MQRYTSIEKLLAYCHDILKSQNFALNEGKSNRPTESNTTRWKQKSGMKVFPKERIVLFSTENFCDDFCSIRFYLHFLAGSCEASRFIPFHRYYSTSDRQKQPFEKNPSWPPPPPKSMQGMTLFWDRFWSGHDNLFDWSWRTRSLYIRHTRASVGVKR